MTKWIQWMVLMSITGSPLLSLGILLVFWWSVDRFTFHILPDPVRGLLRWKRSAELQRILANNPNDRRARFELADLFVQQRRFERAVAVLRPNLEAGDDDAATLFLFGVACHGNKSYDQAERVLLAVKEDEPGFKGGDLDLELGRVRLARGDVAGAERSLRELLERRRSSVEGRVLLARVKRRAGDLPAAKQLEAEAWREYASSPPTHQRRDRVWAWRANPTRPATYAVLVLVAGAGFAWWSRSTTGEALRRELAPRTHAATLDDGDDGEPSAPGVGTSTTR